MKRTFKDYLFIGLKGIAMGAADVVPGVSGGTIAFVSGIYEELLTSISNINIGLIQVLKKEGLKVAWQKLNGSFLLTLFVGIFVSVFSLAKIIAWLLEHQPILLWSFFFGLVLASVIYIAKQVTRWNVISFLLLIIGAVLAYWITTLNPLVSENTSYLYLFVAGALAVCAMILPGISGAFILVLLGAYKPILEAVNDKNITIIGLVGLGAITGLLSFSKILKYFFKNFKDYTLVVLTGFILGSLNKIWPWKKTLTYTLNSHGEKVPFNQLSVSPFSYEGNAQLYLAILLAILGFGLIFLLERVAQKK